MFQPSQYSYGAAQYVRTGAGPATGQYYVRLSGARGTDPAGWHWGILEGRVPETVKIKGPLVPGERVQFKRLWKDTSVQWAVLLDRPVMAQHEWPSGMPGPGTVGFDAYSMHPGVRVVVPAASYGGAQTAVLSTLGIGAVGLAVVAAAGVLLFMPLVVMPAILRAFVPTWSYGRRVVAGYGISLAGSLVYHIAKAAGGGR